MADADHNELLLRSLIQALPHAVLVHQRGVIQQANGAAQRLLGLRPEQLQGARLLELVTPEDREVLIRQHKSLALGNPGGCEVRFLGPGGEMKWVSLAAAPMDGGKRVLCSLLDLTEERFRQRKLLEKERLLESLLSGFPQGISVLDTQMRIVLVNPTMERWYAHSMPLLGKKCFQAYQGALEPCEVCPVIETLKTGRNSQALVPLRDQAGSQVGWLNLYSAPLRDMESGELCGILQFVEDTTQARLALESLRESQELISRAITASSDWISISRLSDGKYIEVNQAFEKKTGYTRGEVLGKSALELGIWVEPHKRQEAINILQETGSLRDFEVDFRMKSGEIRTFSLSVDLIEVSGETCSLAICREITERKELERQLALSQKMEAVGRLAGGVAHDFNNLLTVILGQADLLLVEMTKDDPVREGLEEIRQAAKRAASLTRQLLAFSRRQILQPKILDLNSVVVDMERMLSRLIGEDVEILTLRDPDLWPVKLDQAQIEQVLLNLAVNARDAMPKGGRLRIETSNRMLDSGFLSSRCLDLPAGPYVTLRFSDTGVGMDEQTKQKIFEPFFTTKEKGTGLGLATVYGIVTQSGGYIEVESSPGQGATFNLYFPAAQGAELLGTTGGDSLVGTWTGSQTVLVAEDEETVRKLVCSVLRARGYKVLEAEDGLRASQVEESHQGPIHLLVTDVVMPGLGGRELSEKVRARRPGTKVLYISGYTEEALQGLGSLEGKAHFLSKPFSPDALARKVREILGTY